MDERVDHNEGWAPKNWCFQTVVMETTLESPLNNKEVKEVNPKKKKSTLNIHWKDWCGSWSSNTLATWWEELTHLKRPWCWERFNEGIDRGWDGWMVSLTQWTWVWASLRSWESLVGCSPRGHKELDMTEQLNWTDWMFMAESFTMVKRWDATSRIHKQTNNQNVGSIYIGILINPKGMNSDTHYNMYEP